MAREGIYIDNKEIIQRYVGTQLVWEKRIRVLELFGKRVLTSPAYGERMQCIYMIIHLASITIRFMKFGSLAKLNQMLFQ